MIFLTFSFPLDAIATAEYYKWFMYGPVLVPMGTLGIIGNILSIVVFTRPSMKNSALNCILIGKHTPKGFLFPANSGSKKPFITTW